MCGRRGKHACSFGNVGVALANMLPQFTLSADSGSSALTLGRLFSPYTGFWDLGASLSQTCFRAARWCIGIEPPKQPWTRRQPQYRSTVIMACQNVADTLKALRADADALSADAASDQATKATLDLAKQQFTLGSISLVALLNAEQAWQQAEISLIQARGNRYTDTVALYQALGGGWWNLKERQAMDSLVLRTRENGAVTLTLNRRKNSTRCRRSCSRRWRPS